MTGAAPVLSLVTTCKGRLEHLRQSLPRMAALGPGAEVVVVDYDCPDGAAAWVRSALPAAVVVEVKDRPRFNAAQARNLGAAAASAPWLFFIDADVLAQGPVLPAITPRLAPGRFLTPDPRPPGLWGAVVVAAEDFARIGGYDEVFQGWGAEDDDLLFRLQRAGLEHGRFDSAGLDAIAHDDTLRTRHHDERDLRLNALVNAFYLSVKKDLAALGVDPGPDNRRTLYDDVRRCVAKAATTGETSLLQVAFHRAWAGAGAALSSLCYEIRAPGST